MISFKKYKGFNIKNAPFINEIIDNDMEKVDMIWILHSAKYKHIKEFIDELNPKTETIGYIHRYPKDGDTFIGLIQLEGKKDYFI